MYISLPKNLFLVTNDNWKTTNVSESTQDKKVVTDQDLRREILLRHIYGEKFGDLITDELKSIRNIMVLNGLEPGQHDGYGLAFEVFSVATHYKKTYSYVIKNLIVDGSDDGKVDAIFVNEDRKTFDVIQVKLDSFDSNDLVRMQENIFKFNTNSTDFNSNTKDLYNKLEALDGQYRGELRDYSPIYVVVTSTEISDMSIKNIKPNDIFLDFIENMIIPTNANGIQLRIELNNNSLSAEGLQHQVTREEQITLLINLRVTFFLL